MGILSIFIIAIGLSMDSFAVCIGKGMCRQRFLVWRAFKIALVFGLFQALIATCGVCVRHGFLRGYNNLIIGWPSSSW